MADDLMKSKDIIQVLLGCILSTVASRNKVAIMTKQVEEVITRYTLNTKRLYQIIQNSEQSEAKLEALQKEIEAMQQKSEEFQRLQPV